MNKLKIWFLSRFLPTWAKESLLEENKRLCRRIADLEAENDRLRAYAAGLEYGLKRKIIIKGAEK